MHAHLQHAATYGRTVSEVSRLCRAKPRKDSRLAERITQGAQPDVEFFRAKEFIHNVSTWIRSVKLGLWRPQADANGVEVKWSPEGPLCSRRPCIGSVVRSCLAEHPAAAARLASYEKSTGPPRQNSRGGMPFVG